MNLAPYSHAGWLEAAALARVVTTRGLKDVLGRDLADTWLAAACKVRQERLRINWPVAICTRHETSCESSVAQTSSYARRRPVSMMAVLAIGYDVNNRSMG